MKITKRKLRRIILEAMSAEEEFENAGIRGREIAKQRAMGQPGKFDGSMMDLDDYNSLFAAVDGVVQRYVRMGYDQADVLHALNNMMGDFLK
tara:strand:+ start:653 stop:928 length:276 start_codon:yes stop_codon:yes gene_type:complete